MGSERQCGLGSLLPMSCRGRAEAFARRLHTRLRRLGAEPEGAAHEATWLAGPPSHHADSDVFFDFDVELESPSSPVDEIPESELPALVAPTTNRADPESGCVFSSPIENESPPSNSDSDATYYDLEADPDQLSKISGHLKHHKVYDENQMAKNAANLTKLKLSSPTLDIIDHLFQNKSLSPERKSPIRTQPLARENGFVDYGTLERRDSSNTLYSPIRFDDCQRRNSLERQKTNESVDEVDNLSHRDYCNGQVSPSKVAIDEANLKYKPINGIIETFPKQNDAVCNKSETDLTENSIIETNLEASNINTVEELPENAVEVCDEVILIEEKIPEETVEEVAAESEEDQREFHENDSENDDRPQRVRRCSSLRTGKTPPGTPGRKKIVRFADVLGLDLADVKTFMDDIPNIPKSAFEDLRDADLSSLSVENTSLSDVPKSLDKYVVPIFQQPGDQPNFLDVLNTKSVCLENAIVQEGATIAIFGTVRVRNLDFHKSVQIRYSLDSWQTYSDLQATYVPNSCDGFSDRFQFLLYAHTLTAGQKLEFAVRFMCKGCQFWDNNAGANYGFQCLSSNTSSSFYIPQTISPVDTWRASFY